MESLLSLAFDNLSSFDGSKIKKGLKQVEGLLAQICLSGPSNLRSSQGPQRKVLSDLSPDPAFREFFKLQEGFEWNVAQRLLTTLDWLVVRGGEGHYDSLIVNALDLIQGVLLLHPPSKTLFARSVHMNLLLDLLEPINSPAIQSATIITLVVALLDVPQNMRVFEQLDGLLTITSLFKSRETGREVKFRLTEFLYFYLTPETPKNVPKSGGSGSRSSSGGSGISSSSSSSSNSSGSTAITTTTTTSNGAGQQQQQQQQNPIKVPKVPKVYAGGGKERSGSENGGGLTLSVETKKQYVDRYLPGVVDELLKDLDTYKPFAGVLS
ncbi:putative cell division control protein 14 [Cladorrhinum samala]|uniref:Cell division control protein 14 n=1 Tax=Cladorrhinum samala TaxID=585594 RepID=A0AAV9H952_9PEZI|nr:putative cell division control protein 14 [Cladorrhinum samala]